MSRNKLIETVSAMMKQNTGRHMLDGGMIYGYKYDRLKDVDLTTQPEATLDADGYTKSMFWHLVNTLDSVSDHDADYEKYDSEHTDETWFDTFYAWCKLRGITEQGVENICNTDHVLDGTFQVYELEDADGWNYTAVMTHNGCDYRGGYSRARIFNGSYNEVLKVCYGTIFCNQCDGRWHTDNAYHWYNDDESLKGLILGELFDDDAQCYKCTCGGTLHA